MQSNVSLLIAGFFAISGSCNVVALDAAKEETQSAKARWQAWQTHQGLREQSLFQGLQWRSIGPTVQGGRVVDIESVPNQPYTFYVSYASGGVWKTINNGVTFEPLTDQLPTTINGDLAVDPSNTNRLWLGTGEPNSSRSSYGGMGVFRSDDAGKTWQHKGLTDTDRISHIVINPKNSDHVCVAALGKLYTTGGLRGVFCTKDAGSTWQHTLKGENEWSGASDLILDAKNPSIMYAAMWERSRTAWNFIEGGVGSGIYKSLDGGANWTRLEGGLPRSEKIGRIGLALSESQPNTIYASIDNNELLPETQWDLGDRPLSVKRLKNMSKADFLRQDPNEVEQFIRDNDFPIELDAKTLIEKIKRDEITLAQLLDKLTDANAGLFNTDIKGLEIYRSNDAGKTWARTHAEPLREVTYTYGYYFSTIRVAPDNPEQVYVVGVPMIESKDGGKNWHTLQTADVHVDYHAWWIDPNFPQRMMVGNDGGVDMSYDGGKSWVKLDKQPVGQFYAINVDMAEPYNVYGGLQDNGTYKGSSKTKWELGEDWDFLSGGDGMHVGVDTRDNKTIYTGYQFGWYQRSDGQEVRPRSGINEAPLRYNWNTPVILSAHNQDIVYFGANKLFRSLDQGETWSAISPDLSQSLNRGDVPFATITTISESPKQFGLIWAGTDDGRVHVSESGGQTWLEVGTNLPDAWISRIQASKFVRERAYLTINEYRNDSAQAHVFVTEDLGKNWRSIRSNLPNEAVNVIREDLENENLLYLGTDRGVYASLNRGTSWMAINNNLPNVPVHDLVIHPRERELVAGTHGRSVWILDVLPIQELSEKIQASDLHVFHVSDLKARRSWRGAASKWFDETEYLPELSVPFWSRDAELVSIEIRDQNEQILMQEKITAKRGVNLWSWNLLINSERAKAAEQFARNKSKKSNKEKNANTEGELTHSPYAESIRLGHRLILMPGSYQVHVSTPKSKSKTSFKIDPPEDFTPRQKPKAKVRGRDQK